MYDSLITGPERMIAALSDPDTGIAHYAAEVAAEFGIKRLDGTTVGLEPIERFFDYEPAPIECPNFWCEIGGLDDRTRMAVRSIASELTFPIVIAGTGMSDGTLTWLTKQIRGYGVALTRFVHDQLAAAQTGAAPTSIIAASRVVTGIPASSTQDTRWRLGTRITVTVAKTVPRS